MNFLKNTWKTMFKSQQPNQSNPQSTQPQAKTQSASKQEQQQIPQEIILELFSLSSELVKNSKKITDNETKLKIYGLYKQAVQGDCNVDKPQMFDIVGRSKWTAWNDLQGMRKIAAMMEYIRVVGEADPDVQKQIELKFRGDKEELTGNQADNTSVPKQSQGLKKVQQVDYSDTYSHPYFKLILKGTPIPEIKHELLLTLNNQPAIYPLHFAIDRERPEIVKQFLAILTKEQIESMKDADGTTILEYAECMQNEQILEMVQKKLQK